MLVNSFFNGSFLYPNLSSINSELFLSVHCLIIRPSSYIYTSFNLTTIFLLLPLCILTLYYGLQQWSQNRSTSSAATMSHSDCFTYHVVIMKLISVFGCILSCFGTYKFNVSILGVGACLLYFTWYGQIFFDILTCVERYLAVVHPITYLSLRNDKGVRIRNVTIFCVWLLCFVMIGLVIINFVSTTVDFYLLVLSLSITTFCSLSVLCVLIRPGPGKCDRNREKVDKSKQRAFYIILVILGILVLKFSFSLFRTVLHASGGSDLCVPLACEVWFSLPSSLVLTLLFLHRKLICCKKILE